jgi:hypothetical protein
MFDRILQGGRLAALCLLASLLPACGGGDGGSTATTEPAQAQPSPAASLLAFNRYSVFRHDDGQPFSLHDAGALTNRTAAGGRLALGSGDSTELTVTDTALFTMAASNQAFRIFSRFRGGVLMLCDPAGSAGRYAAIASVLATGDVAATPVFNTAELAGKTFYEVTDCSYRGGSGSQGQDVKHDALTNSLSVAAHGEVSVSRMKQTPSRMDAVDFSTMLHGVWLNTSRYSAFKFHVDGAASYVLIERSSPDEIDRTAGVITLWLPD